MQNDSVSKIITRYFAAVTRVPFTYDAKKYEPKRLKVSPLLLRGYTCPPSCGGCCFKFSLDYLPSEAHPEEVSERLIEFNGQQIKILSDHQPRNDGTRCRYLMINGRCGIYPTRPFTCDFELIRTLAFTDDDRPHVLTQKLFGRGWSYPRVDGGKGALCEMTEVDKKTIAEVLRKLDRLKAWTDYFGIKTWIPEIKDVIQRGNLTRPITFSPDEYNGFGL